MLDLLVNWGPSHLNSNELQLSIRRDSLSAEQEGEVVRDAILILAANKLNQLGSFVTEAESVDLLNLISFLNFGARSDLGLLDLDEVEFAKMLGAAHANMLLAALGNFRSVFLDEFSLDQKEEAHQGGLIAR